MAKTIRNHLKKKHAVIQVVTIAVLFLVFPGSLNAQSKVDSFLRDLDSVRTSLKIPGMALSLKENDIIVAEKGFGYADLANKVKVSPATSFRIASITKTFTSTILMQLVEKGKLDLHTQISKFGLELDNPAITVENLLNHTSEGIPGTHFQYNGFRYGKLGPVIEKAAGIPFFQLLMEQIIAPAKMNSTAPGISVLSYFSYIRDHKNMRPYFEKAFGSLAKAYGLDANGNITEIQYLDEFGAFGGLTSTVQDLQKYSLAIDQHQFVSANTQKLIFTPNKLSGDTISPYGLGWFSQKYLGLDYYWHYGQTQGESGLFVKVPARNLTLVVLTNSERLSVPFPLGDGDLMMSPVGQLLFKYIINRDKNFSIIDYRLPIDAIELTLNKQDQTRYKPFYNKEIIVQATLSNSIGNTKRARELYTLYGHLNPAERKTIPGESIVAAIVNAGINQTLSKEFTLNETTKLRVYGAGENCSSDLSSWCDYGWVEDAAGKIIWQMQGQAANSAGGAIKNQKVDLEISLPKGNYKLKYKSDSGHAFNNWDSLPPDDFFWGIQLSKVN